MKEKLKNGETKKRRNLTVLGIETSCDETAAAVVQLPITNYQLPRRPWYDGLRVVSNVVASQTTIHTKTGGVVPEVAAREHVKAIIPTISAALKHTGRGLRMKDSGLRPDVIAVTNGPGLITSLLVGVDAARTLAAAWNIPLVAVNHLEGHIAAAFLPQRNSNFLISTFQFPALALLVSGGHTELVLMRRWLDYTVIGETLDDAAGEAFDKVAKILEFPYPGGPAIERVAKNGNASKQPFTPPMLNSQDYNFSFSGIKTAALYRMKELKIRNKELRARNDVAAGFQKAVVDVLVAKTVRAAKEYNVRTVILCGGVAANTALRMQLKKSLRTSIPNSLFLIPNSPFCTDNAAMIAAAGALRALHHKFTPWQKVEADPTLTL